jgi:hypothetical protein
VTGAGWMSGDGVRVRKVIGVEHASQRARGRFFYAFDSSMSNFEPTRGCAGACA